MARGALKAVNAAVVGILFAAFCNPVCSSALLTYVDWVVALFCLVILSRTRVPIWLVVLGGASLAHFLASGLLVGIIE